MYEQFQNIMKMGPFNQIIVSNIHTLYYTYMNRDMQYLIYIHTLYYTYMYTL